MKKDEMIGVHENEEIVISILFDYPLPSTEFVYDEGISNIVMASLNKNKGERYQSALEFMNELREIG